MSAPFRFIGSVVQSGSRPPGDRGQEKDFWAIKDISLDIEHGEAIGIIGLNGAGKSTLLKILSRILEPTEGFATIRGRVGSLLEVGTGFHSELSGRENIYLNGAILGMKRNEIARKLDAIVAFAEVEKFLDSPVKFYSSGMYLRLAFAVAAHFEPEILIVDEVLAVGDAVFQKKCLGKMGDVTTQGRTVLFVSHNMDAIQRLCSKTLLLEAGRVAAYDITSRVILRYLSDHRFSSRPGECVDLSGVNRTGSGLAYFSALQFGSLDKSMGFQPYTNGPIEFRLSIISDQTRLIESIGVTLCSRSGIKLVNADTISLGRAITLQKGSNLVILRIESLHLNPGDYSLSLWLADALGHPFDYIGSACSITVVNSAPQGFGSKPESDGIVTCKFQVVGHD